MITFQELRTWSNELKPVLFDINVAASNLFILNHENSNTFKHRHSDLFLNLWYQQYFIVIVQLSKIFSTSDKQKLNINKLCNRYKNEKLDEKIRQILSKNKLKLTDVFGTHIEIKTAVELLLDELSEKSDVIEKVVYLRDKVFAHTDPNSTDKNITLDEILYLTNLATKIYNTLFGKVLDEYDNFTQTQKWDFRTIIEAFK